MSGGYSIIHIHRQKVLTVNLHVMIKNDVLYASIWFQQLLGVPKHALCVPCVLCSMEDAEQCLWLRPRVYTGSKYV